MMKQTSQSISGHFDQGRATRVEVRHPGDPGVTSVWVGNRPQHQQLLSSELAVLSFNNDTSRNHVPLVEAHNTPTSSPSSSSSSTSQRYHHSHVTRTSSMPSGRAAWAPTLRPSEAPRGAKGADDASLALSAAAPAVPDTRQKARTDYPLATLSQSSDLALPANPYAVPAPPPAALLAASYSAAFTMPQQQPLVAPHHQVPVSPFWGQHLNPLTAGSQVLLPTLQTPLSTLQTPLTALQTPLPPLQTTLSPLQTPLPPLPAPLPPLQTPLSSVFSPSLASQWNPSLSLSSVSGLSPLLTGMTPLVHNSLQVSTPGDVLSNSTASLFSSPTSPLLSSPTSPLLNSPTSPLFNSPTSPLLNSPTPPLFNSPTSPLLSSTAPMLSSSTSLLSGSTESLLSNSTASLLGNSTVGLNPRTQEPTYVHTDILCPDFHTLAKNTNLRYSMTDQPDDQATSGVGSSLPSSTSGSSPTSPCSEPSYPQLTVREPDLQLFGQLDVQMQHSSVEPCLQLPVNKELCLRCGKKVYAMEKVGPVKDVLYHKTCFTCAVCQTTLNLKNFHHSDANMDDLHVYCASHKPQARSYSGDANTVGIQRALTVPRLTRINEQIRGGPEASTRAHLDTNAFSIRSALQVPTTDLQTSIKVREGAWYREQRKSEGMPPNDVVRHDGTMQRYEGTRSLYDYRDNS